MVLAPVDAMQPKESSKAPMDGLTPHGAEVIPPSLPEPHPIRPGHGLQPHRVPRFGVREPMSICESRIV